MSSKVGQFTILTVFFIIAFALFADKKPQINPAIPYVKPEIPFLPPPVRPVYPEPVWTEFNAVNRLSNNSWGKVLTDIKTHLPESMIRNFQDNDLIVDAHESTHGIHSYLRNKDNAIRGTYYLYVLNNKSIGIKSPKITISQIANMIPSSMRKSRYQTYLIKQQADWNNDPIYMYDEWIAYTNGAECAIELINKTQREKSDFLFAILEFDVYAIYTCMAVKKHDPTYDADQLLKFTAWNLRRTMRLWEEGMKSEQLNWDNNEYLNFLRTSEDAKELRNFIIATYGKEWAKEVFGF